MQKAHTFKLWECRELEMPAVPQETFGGQFAVVRGGATILRVWGTNITASEASRNFFGLYPPHMPFWGYNSYKERHTESLSDSVASLPYLTGPASAILASI